MINSPLFRALGSLAPVVGADVKSVILSNRSGVLRTAARALAEQANREFKLLNPQADYTYAVVVDAPINGEEDILPGRTDQLRGIISCIRDENGEWRGADENLVLRRDGKYAAVFLGPVSNDGVRNCYLPFLVEGFPTENEPSPSFLQLAGAALRLVAGLGLDGPIDLGELERISGASMLAEVFLALRDAYCSFGNSDVPWNVLWMLHIDEGLARLGRAIETGAVTAQDVQDGSFGNLIYPSFSLPNPESGESYRVGHDLKRAVLSHWGSEDQVLISLENIAAARRMTIGNGTLAKPLILEQLDWADLDVTINKRDKGGRGNQLLGLFWQDSQATTRLRAFADITEQEFFNPTPPISRQLTILNPDQTPLSTAGVLEAAYILEPINFDAEGRRLESREVLVILPMISEVEDSTVLTNTNVTLVDAVPRNRAAIGFEVLGKIVINGQVALKGKFFRDVSRSGDFEHSPSIRNVRVHIPDSQPKDAMSGVVRRDSSASVVLLGPDGAGVILSAGAPKKKISVITWPKFNQSGDCVIDDSVIDREVDPDQYGLVVWSKDLPTHLSVDGEKLLPGNQSWIRLVRAGLDVSSSVVIEIDELTVNLNVTVDPAPVSEAFNSPLRACTEHGQVDLSAREEDLKDVRSSLELKFFEISKTIGIGNRHNGHMVVSSHLGEEVDSLEFDPAFGVHISSSVRGNTGLWPFKAAERVPTEVFESLQLEKFVETFRALKLDEAVERVAKGGGPRWLSKVDLGDHFAKMGDESSRLIDDYLESYIELVSFVDSYNNSSLRFWVRYPFSVSIWGDTVAKLKGVLVSPYHPLRLAWLSTAESVLRSSQVHNETRRMMAGVVSGWQFPMLTRSATQNGAMMAVPIDGGVDSIFAGWTMLVRAPIDQADHLEIPDRAADGKVPGVSSSGLDSTAVEGAVNDFCSANPFVSTLVIDLAAASAAPRPTQLDRGLVQRISKWTKRRTEINQSPGGVRVYDSVNRVGEMSDEVQRLIDVEGAQIPSVTWRRYGDELPVRQANIRIMNDSGVRVSVSSSSVRNGLVADVPLRRFEVAVTNEQSECAESSPMLISSGSSTFGRALYAAESIDFLSVDAARCVSLTVSPDNAMLEGADWTVVGESGLPPSALARLLQIEGVGAGTSTLWEWRPPFFEGSDGASVSTVDRRPYMTLARIPKVYSGKLRGLVRLLLGGEATDVDVDAKVNEVVRILGARGVGLSSLISGKQRHRVHQKGALGFSLAFEMIDRTSREGHQRFVIPIDAAHQYLNVLSGFSRNEGGQRADLLLLELRDEELVLVPLEIKFYALDNPVPTLPNLNSPDVDAAVGQSVAARKLIDDIVSFWASTRGEFGTEELMNNALAALVDAAIRLTSFDGEDAPMIATKMKKLVDGRLSIRAGSPAVAYLVATTDALKSRHTTNPQNGAEVFICDPRQMTSDLAKLGSSKAIDEWIVTLDRAFAEGDVLTAVPGQLPPDAGEPTGTQPFPVRPGGPADVLPESRQSVKDETGVQQTESPDLDGELNQTSDVEMATSPPSSAPTDVRLDQATDSRREASVANETSGEGTADSRGGQVESPLHHSSAKPIEASSQADSADDEGVKIRIGSFQADEGPVYFWPGNTALTSLNVGVLGDMGTGKTQMCLGLVSSLRRASRQAQGAPMSGLILDYKSDYQKEEFLASVGGVVLEPHNLPVDLFGVRGEKTLKKMNAKAMAFIEIIAMVFGGVGNVQRDRLRQVIIALINNKDLSPTLRDVQEAYLLACNNKADSVTEILNNLVYNEVFSSNPAEFQALDEILQEGVAVVNLRALDPDQKTKKTLVAIFLNLYFEYMIGLTKWPYRQGAVQVRHLNSFVLVDEAVNIMEYDFPPLRQILLQGREYGVAAILSSQYLDHFAISGTNYAEPLRTWIVHRVPNVSKKHLNDLGISAATADDASAISDLGLHEGFYATFDCPGAFIVGDPFYAQLERMPESDRKWQ